MQASELVKRLQTLIEEYGDLPVCYGVDDEGNAFKEVHYQAIQGTLNGYEFEDSTDNPTHICVN